MDTRSQEQFGTNQRYPSLIKQVSAMRWVIPPTLAVFVIVFETFEHVVMHSSPLGWDFYIELSIFGFVGPALIAWVLTWLVLNLKQIDLYNQEIKDLNESLELKVAERTEELGQANAELRKLDQLKSEFVALVSHELRAPLTNIQGGLELVLDNEGIANLEQKNLLVIQHEVNRLMRLVQRILDISILEAGQISMNFGPVALRPLIRKVAEQAKLSNSAGYRFTLDLPPNAPLVIADEEHLTDIVTSLLQNAIKYSHEGSEIRIGLAYDGEQAYISIKDQGIGVEAQDIPQLTKKFYRSHVNNHTNGYGLGLYFVNELIKAQNGQLKITSEGIPGHGSTFSFNLPIEKELIDESDPAN